MLQKLFVSYIRLRGFTLHQRSLGKTTKVVLLQQFSCASFVNLEKSIYLVGYYVFYKFSFSKEGR